MVDDLVKKKSILWMVFFASFGIVFLMGIGFLLYKLYKYFISINMNNILIISLIALLVIFSSLSLTFIFTIASWKWFGKGEDNLIVKGESTKKN